MSESEETQHQQLTHVKAIPDDPRVPLYEEGFRELYESLKPSVWVLWVKGTSKGKGREQIESYFTGFSVSSDGLALTCARRWSNLDNVVFKARRLHEEGFIHEVTVVDLNRKWDLALLRIGNLNDCLPGELFQDGTLKEGQTVLHIGHPKDFVGSFLTGHAVYSCVQDVVLPSGQQTCGKFSSEALPNTPVYRIMGHIWNTKTFEGTKGNQYAFEKNLNPHLPIIQCQGLTCQEGSSGGPVFDTRGKIVGMVVFEDNGYQIAIHVTVLRKFLQDNKVLPDNYDEDGNEEVASKRRKM